MTLAVILALGASSGVVSGESAESVLLRTKGWEIVTVRTAERGALTGRLLGVEAGHVTLSPTNRTGYPLSDGEHVVPVLEISQIEVLEDRAGEWALPGALAGGMLALGFGLLLSQEPELYEPTLGSTVVLLGTGSALGALTGFVLGAVFPRWRVRYPLPPES
jgi:hypothetical protein